MLESFVHLLENHSETVFCVEWVVGILYGFGLARLGARLFPIIGMKSLILTVAGFALWIFYYMLFHPGENGIRWIR